MKHLNLYNVDSVDRLAWPVQENVFLNTPALRILTDFQYHRPLVIDANIKALELEQLMKKAQVQLKIVLDEDKNFVGIISANDLSEEKILRKVSRDTTRADLQVKDFMHPRNELKCFDIIELSKASVGDVLEAQKTNKQQHCLVVDRVHHEIRGLISARDVARLLKQPIHIGQPISFEGLFNEIFS